MFKVTETNYRGNSNLKKNQFTGPKRIHILQGDCEIVEAKIMGEMAGWTDLKRSPR